VLIGEGLDMHIPRPYIYFAMAFSAIVEVLNLMAKRQRRLHRKQREGEASRLANPDETQGAP